MNKKKQSIVNLGIVGFGNMAEAILSGLLANKIISSKNVYAFEPNTKRQAVGRKKYKIKFCKDYHEVCRNSNVLLLAIKPQQIIDVLKPLSLSLNKQLIISIVTGIEVRYYQNILGSKIKLIRVMPNTPALIGQGASAYFANKNCSHTDKKICETIFASVGQIMELKKESLINSVTAISGSGPAFVYQYAQSVMDSAQKLGLSQEMSKNLVLQTLLGATNMMLLSHETPDELTKKVTSKGGTTLAGLQVLKKKGFSKIIDACMKRAAKRAEELSQLFGR